MAASSACGDAQPALVVAYQGAEDEAAIAELGRLCGRSVHSKPYPCLDAAFASAAGGEVDLVLARYEMSRGGTAHEVADLLVAHGLRIAGELETMQRGGVDGAVPNASSLTRFLLLRKDPVGVPAGSTCKTSVVFSLPNVAGALSQSLATFARHGINLVKIESRARDGPSAAERADEHPCAQDGTSTHTGSDDSALKRARFEAVEYLFYVDFLGSPEEREVGAALEELQKSAPYFRSLGTYPCRGAPLLGGPAAAGAEAEAAAAPAGEASQLSIGATRRRLRLGIVGFGNFGQFLAKKMVAHLDVLATSTRDLSEAAADLGVTWCPSVEDLLARPLDVLLLSVSIVSFESVLQKVTALLTKNPDSPLPLVVDVLSVKVHPRSLMLRHLPPSCDVLCLHPMFGPGSSKDGWTGLPLVFDRVRVVDGERCEEFLGWWSEQGCRLLQMSCELHDRCAAESQFVTHFTGRVLSRLDLKDTMMNTKNYETLKNVVSIICKNSSDLFLGLYKYNPSAADQLQAFEQAVAEVARELRASAAAAEGLGGN